MSWETLLVVLAGLSAGGLVKGVTGLGLPLIAIPVIAGELGVERAVLVLIVPGVLMNAYQAWTHRAYRHDVPELVRILLWGLPGAAAGASVLYFASDRVLTMVLALWIVAYLLLLWFRPGLTLTEGTRCRLTPLVGLLSGAMQTSTGISAPVIGSYLHALRLRPAAYVFAVAVPFGTFAAAHFVALILFRAYPPEALLESTLAVLPAVVFIAVGERMRRYIRPAGFDLIVRGVLAAMALRLLFVAWG
jgi:uncharacterized membrane protein YfcA